MIIIVNLSVNQKVYVPLTQCPPRIKLLKFPVWQMNFAGFLMFSKKNQCPELSKTAKDTAASISV
jgi:hypothetical protein